ncbi:MAG: electron transport complex subunit RsxC [Eubacteriales bacterium]|nr:electron transport complex subunit RsxC [Eubacteriales bacterium]
MSLFSHHLHSIHVPHHKDTASFESVEMPVPEKVYISMSQHIGRPCQPLVKKGDHVLVGQLIGDIDAPVSAPIYSSVSGDVTAIETDRSALGGMDTYVVIASDGKQEKAEGLEPPVCETKDDFIKAVRASGVVGLGGASFPTSVKFNPANLNEVDTFIVNGAECEPFITSDHRNMLERTDDIVNGIKLIIRYLGISHMYIAIENNKPDAIAKIREAVSGIPECQVHELKSTYPQGAERVLIHEVTGKTLNAGELPASVGCILSNVTTVMVIGSYFRTGMPMVSRNVTIAGNAVTNPGNYIIPIGTRYCDIIDFAGGYKNQPRKIIAGGPMMGKAQSSDGSVTVKNTGAVLFFDETQSWDIDPTPCINCGRCHRACPFGLMPKEYAKAYKNGDAQRLKDIKVMECMNCGSCSFVCPARKPLAFLNTLAKSMVKEAGL